MSVNKTLKWNGDPSGVYEVQFKKQSDTSWSVPIGSPVTGLSISISLEENTPYSFRVRSVCGNSLGEWKTTTFTTPSAECNAVSGIQITDVKQTTANVSWNTDITAVNGYRVEYSLDGSSNWNSSPVIFTSYFVLTGLNPGSNYKVRVVTRAAGDTSCTSSSVSFTTLSVVTQCNSISTTNVVVSVEDVLSNKFKVTFSDVGGIAYQHILEYSLNDGVTWKSPSLIYSQTSNTIIFKTAEGPYFDFKVRVTPSCTDNSVGTPGIADFEALIPIAEKVIIRNQTNALTIKQGLVDSTAMLIPVTGILPNTSFNYNNTILFDSLPHNISLKNTGVDSSALYTAKLIRGGNEIKTNIISFVENTFIPVIANQVFLDGDEIVIDDKMPDPLILTLGAGITNLPAPYNHGKLAVTLNRPLTPQDGFIQFKFTICAINTSTGYNGCTNNPGYGETWDTATFNVGESTYKIFETKGGTPGEDFGYVTKLTIKADSLVGLSQSQFVHQVYSGQNPYPMTFE